MSLGLEAPALHPEPCRDCR